MSQKNFRVYVSSTYEDLQEYRNSAINLLKRAEYSTVAMEDYVATDARPLEKCLQDVANCDLYICIVGSRYGFIPPEEENNARLSITQLEYEQAQKFSKPSLIFILSEFGLQLSVPEENGEQISKLRGFKQAIGLGHVISFVDTPSDLAEKLAASLHNWRLQTEGIKRIPNLLDVVDNEYVDVINYIPGRTLTLKWHPTLGTWIFTGIWLAGMGAIFLKSIFYLEPIGILFSSLLGGWGIWSFCTPNYISFDLNKSLITAKTPGSWAKMPIQARVLSLKEIQTPRDKGKWRSRLTYGGLKIAETDAVATKEEARRKLEPIALSLNYAMGQRFLGE